MSFSASNCGTTFLLELQKGLSSRNQPSFGDGVKRMIPVMIRFPSVLLFSALILSATVCSAEEHFPFVGEVSAKEVNIRAGQSTNFEIIYRLKKGDQILVLGKEFSWYKVQPPPGSVAFIHSKYLQLQGKDSGVVTADKVNLRAATNFNASVLAQVGKDTILTIVGKKED